MSQETNQPDQDQEKVSNSIRPDPLFKNVTRKAALAAGLELLDVELPQLLRADLVLAVPQGKDLSDTMFDFLAAYSIVDFKSENDDFDKFKLATNLARSLLFYAQNKQLTYHQILTVFVCAERPDRVINHVKAEKMLLVPDPATPWLIPAQFGSLQIAIVVCRLLPLERRYYDWLMFDPPTSLKWREFVRMLLRNGERALLEQLKRLRLSSSLHISKLITSGEN
jgi:hypothetical protein